MLREYWFWEEKKISEFISENKICSKNRNILKMENVISKRE